MTLALRGLVLRLRFMGRVAIRADDITSIREETRFLQKVVCVEHRSERAASPVRLACARETAFVKALKDLVRRRA